MKAASTKAGFYIENINKLAMAAMAQCGNNVGGESGNERNKRHK